MAAAVTFDALQQIARQYQTFLRTLYAAKLSEEVPKLGINFYPNVDNEDIVSSLRRKRGVAKPYQAGETVINSLIGKILNSKLRVEEIYGSIKDNLANYKEVTVFKAGEQLGTNQNKTNHPFVLKELESLILTFGEDTLDSLFHGERDFSDKSLGLYDGILTKLDEAIVASLITPEASGSLADPGTATTSWDSLVAWVRKAHYALRANAVLYMTPGTYQNIMDGMNNALKIAEATQTVMEERLNALCSSKIQIINTPYMGTGDKLVMTVPGNFDFGTKVMGDFSFVSLRQPFEDPNDFQLWIQASAGTRINVCDNKTLFVNTGTLVANQVSGDYVS